MHKEYIQRSVSAQSGVRTLPIARQLVNSPEEYSRPNQEKGLSQTKQRDDKVNFDQRSLQIENHQGHRSQSQTDKHEASRTRIDISSQIQDSTDGGNNFFLKGRAMQTQRYSHANTPQHSSMAVITEVLDEDAPSTRSNSPTKVTSRPESKNENPPKTGGEKNMLPTTRVELESDQNGFQQQQYVKSVRTVNKKTVNLEDNASLQDTSTDVRKKMPNNKEQDTKESKEESGGVKTISKSSVSDKNEESEISLIELPVSPTVTVKTHSHRIEQHKVISEPAGKKR